MSIVATLPSVSSEGGLPGYLTEIRKFPLLESLGRGSLRQALARSRLSRGGLSPRDKSPAACCKDRDEVPPLWFAHRRSYIGSQPRLDASRQTL